MADERGAPPDIIQQLVHGFQYETKVDIPGPNGEAYSVTIGVLWGDEIRELQRDVGYKVNINDFVSRELETRFETVVRATINITAPHVRDGSWDVIISDDAEETRARRLQLRALFAKMPRTVDYLFQQYQLLVQQRDAEFDKALAHLKKSSRTPNVPDELGRNLPESFSSGEDGGESIEPGSH